MSDAYIWLGKKGHEHRGTIYVVPLMEAPSALATLRNRFGEIRDVRYDKMNHDEAREFVRGGRAAWAHTSKWEPSAPDEAAERADTIEASRWLWSCDGGHVRGSVVDRTPGEIDRKIG